MPVPGFVVGDIVSLAKLVTDVYRLGRAFTPNANVDLEILVKHAPKHFADMAAELFSLHAMLEEVMERYCL